MVSDAVGTELLVLLHDFSAEGQPGDAARIYGTLPDAPRGRQVVDINLGRYISLDDSVDLEDVSLAFDCALSARSERLDKGFNALTHSTGALVVRTWVRCRETGTRWRDSSMTSPRRRMPD